MGALAPAFLELLVRLACTSTDCMLLAHFSLAFHGSDMKYEEEGIIHAPILPAKHSDAKIMAVLS